MAAKEKFMTSTTDQPGPAPAATAEAKPAKKAHVGRRARNVAPGKAKLPKQATPARKAQKRRTKAEAAKPVARTGSKTAKILDMLRRPGGATAKQLMRSTGWQPHSVRGFLSGTIGKKMGLTVKSVQGEDGERTYSVK
jgi:hypothetical protein